MTPTEDRLLKKRRQRMGRPDALAFLRVSPKARTYSDGLPSQAWRTRLVGKVARELRRGMEPKIATRIGIREVAREVRMLRERLGEEAHGLGVRGIAGEVQDALADRARRKKESR